MRTSSAPVPRRSFRARQTVAGFAELLDALERSVGKLVHSPPNIQRNSVSRLSDRLFAI